jgi:hypothetical protein
MSPRLSCIQAQELAPELALGIISGDDRALLLSHIATCAPCRRLVEKLSERADALLLLAPDHEPPAGFESKVLSQVQDPRRSRRATVWIAAAAALVVGLSATGGVLWATAEDREIASHYKHALAEANGDYFGVKALHAPDGSKVGNVFAYGGETDWIFVVFTEEIEPDVYAVGIKTKGRGMVGAGAYTLGGNERTWGADLTVEMRDIEALVLTNRSDESFEADFSH